jgi:hypothetical protein
VAIPLTWMVQVRGLFAGSSRPLRSLSEDCPGPCIGRGHDLYADTRGLRIEEGCGLIVDMESPSPWTVRGHGQSEDMACTRPDSVRGLSVATDIGIGNSADIPLIYRDFFADINSLWLQGVRRPLLNPQV